MNLNIFGKFVGILLLIESCLFMRVMREIFYLLFIVFKCWELGICMFEKKILLKFDWLFICLMGWILMLGVFICKKNIVRFLCLGMFGFVCVINNF